MRLIALVLATIIALAACGPEAPDEAEARLFDHPTTGMQYLYFVPWHSIRISTASEFCAKTHFFGGGWRHPTIDELRAIATDCEKIMTGGSCRITETCTDIQKCLDNTECNCDGDPTPDDTTCHMLIKDPDKECKVLVSSTIALDNENKDLAEYWYFGPWAQGSIYRTDGFKTTDIMCIRQKQ